MQLSALSLIGVCAAGCLLAAAVTHSGVVIIGSAVGLYVMLKVFTWSGRVRR